MVWDESAEALIADMGETGDFGPRLPCSTRRCTPACRGGAFRRALDVGCGEAASVAAGCGISGSTRSGIDPTDALLRRARDPDPAGTYIPGRAEALPFADGAFDLVVSYLTLIDIRISARRSPRWSGSRPRGTLLIANLNSFATAAAGAGTRTAFSVSGSTITLRRGGSGPRGTASASVTAPAALALHEPAART